MTTFSQLIDEVTIETRRIDMLADASSFANLVIRELHVHPTDGAVINFDSNLVEEVLTTVDTSHVWAIPRRHLFQRMQAVYYPSVGKSAKKLTPSTIRLQDITEYWYRTGDSVAFSGFGNAGATIDLAYYEYPRGLVYQPPATRDLAWDENTQAYVGAGAMEDSVNWLLERHGELVKLGVKAKLYARLSKMDTSKVYFSMYMQARSAMIGAESYENTEWGDA